VHREESASVAVEVKLPQLAASMADGVISKWLVQVGQPVKRGEPLFEVESDKVTTEVESPADGVVRQIRVPEGQKVDVGTVLAIVAASEEAQPTSNGGGAATATAAPPAWPPGAPPAASEKLFVSPRARKAAADLGVDLHAIQGTGPGGRILERDVAKAASAAPVAVAPLPPPASPAAPSAPTVPPVPSTLPLTGMRRTIAERLLRSQQTVAEVTITSEADVAEVVKLRQQVSAEWEKQHGFKVSYTEVIVKAVAKALREHPHLNASLGPDGIQTHPEVNVGVAVALADGLIVPVIRQADQKSLVELARSIHELAERARRGELTRDEVTGGTFSISNLGTFGVETFTPIINWPECAILGVGRIADRAVVREGQIVSRPTLWLSLTFDHRLVDGAPAAQFLGRVRQLLENPYLLFV
jgi:pyruvate dehydrogenase E2 component (dihydrolipoamide acetyltransferase)